ncbi:MAG: hypothetical protein WDO56_22535 [Gammaproteobacteria bacterium]
MNVLVMLIRREFWENRVLVIAPVVVCVLYFLLFVLGSANFHLGSVYVADGGASAATITSVMHIMFTGMLYLLTAIVTFFYLCDSLYSERKDRSILFWKSLPVSDAMTVVSKLLVALIAVPLVVFVLSVVTHVCVLLAAKVVGLFYPPRFPASHWTMAAWLRLNGYLFIDVFVLALWYAPIAAYQLLMSVVAPRAVFVCTVLPPLVLIFGQKVLTGSWSIGEFVLYRLGGVSLGGSLSGGLDAAIDGLDALPMLRLPGLWIGVAVAAVLVFAAIRVRRHRDDS